MSIRAGLSPDSPESLTLTEFGTWMLAALGPHGFHLGNTLALVGVCRDEMMFATEAVINEVWGPAFDISSLGAMVFLGSSGMAAAAHHAPGLDGRRRYVLIVLPHIGCGDDGTLGEVRRDGHTHTTPACGALVVLHRELVAGVRKEGLERHDLEMSMLRSAMLPHIPVGEAPDLVALTDLARRVSTEEMVWLSQGLVHDDDADVAVISGAVVHHHDHDRVVVAEAWVTLRADTTRLQLPRGSFG
ncbi:MAG: hypothetical protein ACH37H_16255 [Ilumatobacteraceae bacterium]